MGRFLDELDITPLDEYTGGRRYCRLLDKFRYEVGKRFSGLVIEVPAGYRTDFASIPRFFQRLFPAFGQYAEAAVIHDYCYDTKLVSRPVADAILWEAMGAKNVPAWKKAAIYLAVRVGGWVFYYRKTRAAKPAANP